jgi:TonB family protein
MWILLLAFLAFTTGFRDEPQALWAPRPVCPDSAQFSDVAGSVTVEMWVDKTGHVREAKVTKSNLPPSLEARALEAASRWVLTPLYTPRGPYGVRIGLRFLLARRGEGPNDSVDVDLDLSVPDKPVSPGETVEIAATVNVNYRAGMRIVLDVPGRIVLTAAESLSEPQRHQGGELVLRENGLQWIGTVEKEEPLVLRHRYVLTSCGDSVVVTCEPGSASYFVRSAEIKAVKLKCR